MKRVITYGTYDLLHSGHIALLKRAKELGDYLIVGVTSDSFDKSRGKLNVKQSLVDRIEAVRKTGIADEIIVEEYEGQKISDIQKYKIDIFTVGSDWAGKFDYIDSYCKVVYLPRTLGVSSTDLRENMHKVIQVGLIGSGYDMQRFYDEAQNIGGLEIIGKYNPYNENTINSEENMAQNLSLSQLLKNSDAVYINTAIDKHYGYVMQALENGCHVICLGPMFLSGEEADKAHQYAREKGLVLFEAVKTLYFPAFEHLLLLIGSGIIGNVRDVEVACSQVPFPLSQDKAGCQDAFLEWGGIVLLPIIKVLGTKYRNCYFYYQENAVSMTFTRGVLEYGDAVASFKVGKGIKFEGSLVITGETGYIFVPAPWWKMDYFEVRYEDLRKTKKYFFAYDGEGVRYEIQRFIETVNYRDVEMGYSLDEMLCETSIVQQYFQHKKKYREIEKNSN